jgi:hypothetical protein
LWLISLHPLTLTLIRSCSFCLTHSTSQRNGLLKKATVQLSQLYAVAQHQNRAAESLLLLVEFPLRHRDRLADSQVHTWLCSALTLLALHGRSLACLCKFTDVWVYVCMCVGVCVGLPVECMSARMDRKSLVFLCSGLLVCVYRRMLACSSASTRTHITLCQYASKPTNQLISVPLPLSLVS